MRFSISFPALGALLLLGGCAAASAPLPPAPPGPAPDSPVGPAAVLSEEERVEGWIPLFDGRTLEGWEPRGEAEWVVEDGVITARESLSGHLATTRAFRDFRLRAEFWTDEGTNSGIFLRAPASGPISLNNAIEINIWDDSPDYPTGSVNQFDRNTAYPRTAWVWNRFEILVRGDRVRVELNGERTSNVWVSNRLPSGPISLQYTGGTVRFRNLRILPL